MKKDWAKRDKKGRFVKGSGGFWKGKKLPYRKKLSEIHKELVKKGKNVPPSRKGISPANKGKPRLDITGEKNPNWKGGVSKNQRPVRSIRYKKWRMAVFMRDDFTCQFCGIRGVYLEAHHIKPWSKYPKLRFDVNNGVTLCRRCHDLTKTGRK
ncbi:MAG: HNH endonuclease [Candidatus Hodarchaeales archaeon]